MVKLIQSSALLQKYRSNIDGYRSNIDGYRSDIDGLRAVAILSVVGFHFFPSIFHGGFVGVDIFFVISGYLISTIIFKNILNNKFSFIEFFSRRIRRLFPALIIIFVFSFIVGWVTLLPDEYKLLNKHIFFSTGFIQNFLLWRESGYFDFASNTKPLLHLWSLAIEEQFYIFFPVLLYFLRKKIKLIVPVLILILFVSFTFNYIGVYSDSISTFYSPHTRFWELIIGSLLSYFMVLKKKQFISNTKLKNFYLKNNFILLNFHSLIGFILIGSGIFFINKEMFYPGIWALLPTLGAVFIISSNPQSYINRNILSQPIMVWFGLISYPLYLWHWTLLSFAIIIKGQDLSANIKIYIILISIVLAWLTYSFVEKPIRSSVITTKKIITLITLFALISLISFFFFYKENILLLYKNYPKLSKSLMMRGYPEIKDSIIYKKYNEYDLRIIGENTKKQLILLGDSHRYQYDNLFANLVKKHQKVNSDTPSVIFGPGPELSDLNGFRKISLDENIKEVVISYFWAGIFESDKVNRTIRCCGGGASGSVGVERSASMSSYEIEQKYDQLSKLITILVNQGKKVYIVLDNPFGEELYFRTNIKRETFIRNSYFRFNGIKKNIALDRSEPIRSRIIEIALKNSAYIIDPYKDLCNKDFCPSETDGGEFIYKDYDHLSVYATQNLVRYFDFFFDYNK
jgi:peptidoglycan/LPS O-acetylase OafA/YrhL